jgi:preprotein translocase subunit YajC
MDSASTPMMEPLLLAQAAPDPIAQFVPMILILGVFYMLLIRPQQQKARQHEDFVKALKKGESVVTAGGLYGRVVELGDNDVTLEIAPNVRVKHERSKIAAAVGKGGAAKAD